LRNGLLPAFFLPSCLSSFCLLIVCTHISSLLFPLSPVYFQSSCPSAIELDYSSLFVIQGFLRVQSA
jgi:hypothetical protein